VLAQDRDDRSQYRENDAAVLGVGHGECSLKLVHYALPRQGSLAVFIPPVRLTMVRWIPKQLFTGVVLPK